MTKTYILSKFIHLFTCLPDPPNETIIILEKLIFNFIWDGKPDKINRKQIAQHKCFGGLKMTNLINFIKSLKISWIRRLLKSDNEPWAVLFKSSIANINC